MSAAKLPIPATGKKNPPLSPPDVAIRLVACVTVDSIMDPSMIICCGATRVVMALRLCVCFIIYIYLFFCEQWGYTRTWRHRVENNMIIPIVIKGVGGWVGGV